VSRRQTKLRRDGTHGVSRGATGARLPTPGEFSTRPSDAVIDAFVQHVREAGEPESFPSITTTKPRSDSRPVFLRRFSIDRKKRRDGEMAPCPICSPESPKYLHDGYLTWYPDECAIRAIGPECGDTVFGGTQYAEAKAAFDLVERERVAVEFLHKNLPKALSMLVALTALEDAATEAERLHEQLRKSAPRIHAKLRQMKSAGGAISVSIVREKTKTKEDARSVGPRGFGKADSDYDAIEEVFGHFPDTTALYAKFEPMKELRELLNKLTDLPQLRSSDEAFLWACDASESLERLEAAVAILHDCAAGYVRLAERLDRFAEFFSITLFDALDRWGNHEDSAFHLEAEAANGVFRLEHAARWNDRDRVVLRPDMAKLMRRGNLPAFE
jgi:hypothetical protein